MIKIIFNIFCKNKSVHKMIFEITKLKNLRISFHKYKCMFYLKDSPLPAFMMQSILMAKNQFKSNNCEKIFGIECNWNNIDQFCKYAHQQTWKLKSTTLLVWGWFQYRGSKYQTVYHKKIIGIHIIYTGMFICFFLEATFCTLQCCYLLILKKDLFIFIALVILFFLDQHALVPLTTGVYINSNRLLCA